MKIILNRDDIEEAIEKYIREKFMPYGDDRKINITQGTKAMATVVFVDSTGPLPGLEDANDDEPFEAFPSLSEEVIQPEVQ